MIRLVPMTEAEFQAYLEQSIANYAQEHIKAGRWSPEDGLHSAQAEYQQLLPDGLATKDNYLFSIEDEELGKKVGILWFAVLEREGQTSAFVCEIAIDEEFRRHGYGSQAFQALEEKVRALGLNTISLHVFGHNHAARAMYEKLGYITTNVLMKKTLSSSDISS